MDRFPIKPPLQADLEGLLPSVDQLVSLQFGALHEGLAALGADVDARSVGVQVFPHGCIVPEHLGAALHTHTHTHTHRMSESLK